MRPGGAPEGPERSGGRRCRRAPGVRRLVGECRVEAGRKRTNFHRKLTPLPPGPPLTHRVGADCKVREVRAGGPRPLMPSRASARRPIYLYWLFSLTRRYHVARLTPADSHGARSCSSGVPARRTTPDAMPPLRPVAAHKPPDAPNLSIGQGDGELSIQDARPGQQALVRSASGQLAERREQVAVAPRCRRQWAGRARASSARS